MEWRRASLGSSFLPEKSSNACLSGFSVPSCERAESEPGDRGQNNFCQETAKMQNWAFVKLVVVAEGVMG